MLNLKFLIRLMLIVTSTNDVAYSVRRRVAGGRAPKHAELPQYGPNTMLHGAETQRTAGSAIAVTFPANKDEAPTRTQLKHALHLSSKGASVAASQERRRAAAARRPVRLIISLSGTLRGPIEGSVHANFA